MWKLVLMTDVWYALHYENSDDMLLDIEDEVFEHVRQMILSGLPTKWVLT